MGKKNKGASKAKKVQEGVELDREAFSCSICLDVLKDPVSTSCGHSYCMMCVKSHWDEEDQRGIYSCPQCRTRFKPRPVLKKNIMLAALVEQLKRTGLQADPCCAGAEDVSCDVCSGGKLKAIKSCLVCLASYCEKHLQPHYDSAPLQKHKLVEPSKKLLENVCSSHGEAMKMFCRTDQKCICYLCSVEEHKGHDTVSAAAERAERQRELQVRRETIQQDIRDRENHVKLLQQEAEAVDCSADKTVEDSEKIFTQLIRLVQKRSSDVKQQIRSRQETEASRVRELQEKLEQEMKELKRKDAELEQLSLTEDHNQFLHSFPSASALSESPHSSSVKTRPLRRFEDVTAAVEELRDVLQDVLRDTGTDASEVDVSQSEPGWELEPESRAGFLKYSRDITVDPNTAHSSTLVLGWELEPESRAGYLKYYRDITVDPNTAHTGLFVSEGNRKITVMSDDQLRPHHPDRFTGSCCQVLSRESLTGRCYWEVEPSYNCSSYSVAVAYRSIDRAGLYSFGHNDKSWAFSFYRARFHFWHNNIHTSIPAVLGSSRIGVYLDHRAGVLSFYRVTDTMSLLHRVQTTFTEPLHAGLFIDCTGDSAEFCKPT